MDKEAIARKYSKVLDPLTRVSRLYVLMVSLLAGIVFWSVFAFSRQ